MFVVSENRGRWKEMVLCIPVQDLLSAGLGIWDEMLSFLRTVIFLR
jgi:hypothetical protein